MKKNIVVVVLIGLVVLLSTLWMRELQHSKEKEKEYRMEIEYINEKISKKERKEEIERVRREKLEHWSFEELTNILRYQEGREENEINEAKKELTKKLFEYSWKKRQEIKILLSFKEGKEFVTKFIRRHLDIISPFESALAEYISGQPEEGLELFANTHGLIPQEPELKAALYRLLERTWERDDSEFLLRRMARGDQRVYVFLEKKWTGKLNNEERGRVLYCLEDRRSMHILTQALLKDRDEWNRHTALASLERVAASEDYPGWFIEIMLEVVKKDPSLIVQYSVTEILAKEYKKKVEGRKILERRWKYGQPYIQRIIRLYAPEITK